MGISRRLLRLATPQECVSIFGYSPGSIPPIALKPRSISILLDVSMQSTGLPLLCGGGGPDRGFVCSFDELVRLCPGCIVMDISRDYQAGEEEEKGGNMASKGEEQQGGWEEGGEGQDDALVVRSDEISFLVDSMLTR